MNNKYTDEALTKAILMVLNHNMTLPDVSKETGINIRALYRYKNKYLGEKNTPPEVHSYPVEIHDKDSIVTADTKMQETLDRTLIARAKFLDDVMETKQVLLDRIKKVGKNSQNIDAMQKALKTLNDIEREVVPSEDSPAIHAKTVNMFQFINNKLLQDGYKGPELTDADIVKGN